VVEGTAIVAPISPDEFCEARCRQFYHEKLGRPSLAPAGITFRWMLIGLIRFFEGIESEWRVAWRVGRFIMFAIGRTPNHEDFTEATAAGRGHASGSVRLGVTASDAGRIAGETQTDSRSVAIEASSC